MAAKKNSGSSKKAQTPAAQRGIVGRVHVDSTTARDDSDVGLGHFAETSDGRYGVVESVIDVDNDGYPDQVILRTRDDESERLVVEYSDLSPSQAGKR